MNKLQISLSIVILSFGLLVSYALIAQALSVEDVVYPVAELGNCKNEAACRAYCDKSQNTKQCLDFAEKYNLIPEDELKMARRFVASGQKGPGGCNSKDSCETYCNDVIRIDECLAFAEENEMMSPEELKEAKMVQAALKKGAKVPGGCRNKNECDVYCENPDHMEECISFGEAAGFIPADELEEAHQVLEAMRKGAKPPPCRGKKECDSFCAEPDNFEQCIAFAEAAGFVSAEEAAMARKTGGKGPGDCKGKEGCDAFCKDENNFQICVDFAVEHGMMSAEDAEMAKKTGGKGPGDCKGKEECEAFCQNPANQEICFNFAKEHNLIPENDLKQMEEGRQQMREALNQAPPQVVECLSSQLGSESVDKIKSGADFMPNPQMGDVMKNCFEQMRPMTQPPEGMPPGGEGFPAGTMMGPGGCKTPEECGAYCESNPQECGVPGQVPGNMMPPEGMMQPGNMQPPEGMMQPQEMMPPQEIAPPPQETTPPPPQSFLNPPSLGELVVGLLANLFLGIQR